MFYDLEWIARRTNLIEFTFEILQIQLNQFLSASNPCFANKWDRNPLQHWKNQ